MIYRLHINGFKWYYSTKLKAIAQDISFNNPCLLIQLTEQERNQVLDKVKYGEAELIDQH